MQPLFRLVSRLLRALGVFLVASGPAFAQEPGHHDLHILVVGLQSDQGQAMAALYREGDDLPGKPRAKQARPIVDRKAELSFSNLEAGRYAVIVFHDLNGNNDLDHNFLRLPAEPIGFSNGFELGLTSGMPNSRKLAFTLDADTRPLEIRVK